MKMQEAEVKPEKWLTHKGLMLHTGFFEKGIVVVKDQRQKISDTLLGPNHLTLDGIKLNFIEPSSQDIPSELKKFDVFLQNDSSQSGKFHTEKLSIRLGSQNNALFLPFIFNNDKSSGLYLYPLSQLTDKKSLSFCGFTRFITVGRLIDSSILGINQHECEIQIIRCTSFFENQKIVEVTFDKEINPYEEIFFIQFERICIFIDIFSIKNFTKKLDYYLPYYDYILLSINLFLNNKMTLDALNEFIKIIFQRKSTHLVNVQTICQSHDIELNIISPFENLFGQATSAKDIFRCLRLDAISDASPPMNEEKFIQDILQKLTTNNFNTTHRDTWKDFCKTFLPENIQTMNSLLNVSKAFVVAITSKERQPLETCALLPISEKDIYEQYSLFIKQHQLNKYPPIFSFIVLDLLLSYESASTPTGLLFNFNAHGRKKTLCNLVQEGILEAAAANLDRLLQDKKPTSLQQWLNDHFPSSLALKNQTKSSREITDFFQNSTQNKTFPTSSFTMEKK